MLVLAAATDMLPHDASYLCYRRLVLATQAIAAVVAAAAGGADAARAGVMGAVLGLLGLIDAALLTMRCLALQSRSRHDATAEEEGEEGEGVGEGVSPPAPQPSASGDAPGAREMQRADREMPAVGEGAVPYTRWNTPPISPRSPHTPTATPSGTDAAAAPTPADSGGDSGGGRLRCASRASRVRVCMRGCCCSGTTHAKARRRCVACGAACYGSVVLALLAASVATFDPLGARWAEVHTPFYGVNLGGWLLTERWLNGPKDGRLHTLCCGWVESPYNGSSKKAGGPNGGVQDEHSLSRWLRARGEASRLVEHRDTYVTRHDFVEAHRRGLNALRLPFGYWLVAQPVTGEEEYIVGAGWRRLDDAVRWAEELGLKLVLDLHGAPGSQNGKQTSGWEDPLWTATHFDQDAAVQVIANVSRRYSASPAVIAIEVLNEAEVPPLQLLDYYRRAYTAVRDGGMEAARVAVVINLYATDGTNVLTEAWGVFNWHLPPRLYPNLVFELHVYYAFNPELYRDLTFNQLTYDAVELQSAMLELTGRPCFVGEWSLAMTKGRASDEMHRQVLLLVISY